MKNNHRLAAVLLLALASGVRCNVLEFNPAQQTKASLDVGGQVKVFCSSPDEIRACIFRSPLGETYVFLDGDKYENDRITNYLKTDNQCGMEIHSLEDGDNGQWECLLTTRNPDTQQSASLQQYFNLEIAVPPMSVSLSEGGNSNLQQLDVTRKSGQSEADAKYIECIATAARPEPVFKWMIGDEEMSAEIDVTSYNLDETSGKADYKSTFTYYADKNHNQKELVCRVEHRGYTQAQEAEKQNEAKLRLNVNYAPMAWTKPQTFYKMVIGQEAKIDVHIEANPKPDSAKWLLGNGTELPAGSSSDDGKFTSGVLVPGNTEGQWIVQLTINNLKKEDTLVTYKLEVENSQGKNEYEVRLETDNEPGPGFPDVTPVDTANFPVVIIILVIVIVLAVVLVAIARVKGMLCFAAKNSDDSDPEKEAFDNAEKGESAPIVDTAKDSEKPASAADANSSPEKKAPVVTETDTTKDEDKKSNGTTPV